MVKLAYELLFVLSASSALLSTLSLPLGLGETNWVLFLITVVLSGLLVVIKNSNLTGRLICIGILSSLSVFLFFLLRSEIFIAKALDNLHYLWIPFLSLLSFILGELLAYIRPFNNVTAILSLISLIPFVFIKNNISKLTVATIFFFAILTLAKEIELRWKKSGNTEIKTHLVFISPFIILTAFLVFISPASDKPYNWSVIKHIYKYAVETIHDIKVRASIRKDEDYVESIAGFSESGTLNGNVKNSNERVLTVIGIPSQTDELKLAGKNFSTFTGRGWIDEDTSSAPDSMFDTIGFIASVDEYSDNPENIYQWDNLYIRYEQMNTSYIFMPPKSAVRKSDFPIYTFEIQNSGSDLLWPETKSYKTSYKMAYLIVNNKNEEYIDFVKKGMIPSKESYTKALLSFGLSKDRTYSYDAFLDNRDHIKEVYCKDVILSDNLASYTEELFKDCDNDYDKLMQIKRLLKSFKYNTQPGKLPDDVTNETEFLDYFIFEKQEGYCNFFATAFVLLARSQGISARYVQGYSSPTYQNSGIYISSSRAHAWAEVYIDGAGWIPIDATPGSGEGAYWASSTVKQPLPPIVNYEEKKDAYAPSEINETPEVKSEDDVSVKWYIFAIPIIFGIMIFVLFFIVFRIISISRFKKLDQDKQFVILSRQIFLILKYLGHPLEDGETISEYKARLKKDYSLSRLEYMDTLELCLYSQNVSDEVYKTACRSALIARNEFLYDLRKKSFIRFIRYYLKL